MRGWIRSPPPVSPKPTRPSTRRSLTASPWSRIAAMGARATRSGSSTSTSRVATSGSSPASTRCSGRRSTSSRTSWCSSTASRSRSSSARAPPSATPGKAEAVTQFHRYQEAGTRWKDQGAPKLFEAAQILVATCGERAVYGTVGTPARFFLAWKEPAPGAADHRADHRPGLRPRLRRPHRRRAGRHQAAVRHRAGDRRCPASHRGDLPGPHRPLHSVHRPQ